MDNERAFNYQKPKSKIRRMLPDMKEISSETFLDMQTAVGLQTEQTFKNDFYFNREFPENLQFLETLSWNFLWSWQRDGAFSFRELDAMARAAGWSDFGHRRFRFARQAIWLERAVPASAVA